MSRSSEKWSYGRYALALRGHDDMPALRRAVKGFTPDDGYDLRKFNEWTSARKKRVRKYYEDIHFLMAQERRIVYPRKKEVRDKLQHAFHGDVASKMFKAVFIPYVTPILSSGETHAGKITYTDAGIKIHNGGNVRHFEPFDQLALAKNPKKEIKRVTTLMKGASLFYVQVNEFQTLNGAEVGAITDQVLKYVARYDGVKALPRGRHYGDRPKDHYYGDWLKGLVGYELGIVDIEEMNRKIVKGILDAKTRRKAQDKAIRKITKVRK